MSSTAGVACAWLHRSSLKHTGGNSCASVCMSVVLGELPER